MQGTLEQKYRQIFEVKIKQERLCQLLENFSIKIHHLEENYKSIQNTISINNILDQVKKYVKTLVKQENTQMIYKFYEKIEVCNKDINRIEYSSKNFEKNMRAQFDSLNQKQKLLQKTVSYMNTHEILRLQNELMTANSNITLAKSELLHEIAADRHKFKENQEKFHAIDEMLENGEEKLQNFQQIISTLAKRINQHKYSQSIAAKFDNDKEKQKEKDKERQKQKDKERQKQRIPPAQIIKKSRISARRTIDNTSFQRSFDQTKEAGESRDQRELKQTRQSKENKDGREGKDSDLQALHKKIENLERRFSGIIESNPNIPTTQNIQNQRESLISTQQLMQFNKFDSTQNIERPLNKSSFKRKDSNFKRGSIRTEDNRDSCIQDYSRSYFGNNNANELRKMNERLTSLHFKYTLLQQNYDALLGKINKLGSLQANIQAKIDEAQKIRVDVNTINEIKLRFKQIQTSMELEQIKYVNNSIYQKQIENINKRITAIDSTLPIYAKKEEVVSAFTFVENKIKQIVIVLSNKFEEEKMGAINKIQHIRCLTCDKQTNLTDLPRPNTRVNIRNCQNNRFSYDKTEITKRIKTELNQ